MDNCNNLSGQVRHGAQVHDLLRVVNALKEALKGDNADDIKAKKEELTQSFYKISEEIYKQAAAAQQAAGCLLYTSFNHPTTVSDLIFSKCPRFSQSPPLPP